MDDDSLLAAHRHFSIACYNAAWPHIENEARDGEAEDAMISLAHASFWHWSQRPDCTPVNMSVGAWLLARVHALAGHADLARRWGERCVRISESPEVGPFFRAYAQESLARAARVAGNREAMERHRAAGIALCPQVQRDDDRELLLSDLESLV